MKICNKCGTQCYDDEMFCHECGVHLEDTCVCKYCDSKITAYLKQCQNCGGVIDLELCPETARTHVCKVCGCATRRGKFCSNCGNRYKASTPISKKIIMGVFIALGILIILGMTSSVIDTVAEERYHTSYMTECERMYELSKNAEYIKVTADELSLDVSAYPVGSYLEITGVISDQFYELLPQNITQENRKFQISIYYYDYETHNSLVETHVINDIITMRVCVTEAYEYLGQIDVMCYSIVD